MNYQSKKYEKKEKEYLNSPEHERNLLYSLMSDNDFRSDVIDDLIDDLFTPGELSTIFKAIKKIHNENGTPEIPTIIAELKSNNVDIKAISDISDSFNIDPHYQLKKVYEYYEKRLLKQLSMKINIALESDQNVDVVTSDLKAELEAIQKKQRDRDVASLLEHVYTPQLDDDVDDPEPTVFLKEQAIGRPGDMTSIIGSPGSGKTTLISCLLSSLLNNNVDNLGLQANCKRAIYFDLEQTKTDTKVMKKRILKRSGVTEAVADQIIKLKNMREFENIEDVTKVIYHFIDISKYDLIIIDPFSDLVKELNSEAEAVKLLRKILAKIEKTKATLILLQHNNPRDQKAAGHLGTKTHRKAAVQLFTAHDTKNDVYVITNKYLYGKNRRGSTNIEAAFKFDQLQKTFVSTEYIPLTDKEQKKVDKLKQLAIEVFDNKFTLSYANLVSQLEKITDTGNINCKKKVSAMLEFDLIMKDDSNNYILNFNEFE
jgi:replicative DNA helicase